jgi:hypothetical protein
LIVQKIAENNIKILEIESESLLDNVSFWEKSWNVIKTGGSIAGAQTANYITGLQNQSKKVREVTTETDKWRGMLTKTYLETDRVLGALETYNITLENTARAEERAEQAGKDAASQKKAVDQAYKDGLKALTNYTEALAMYTKQTKELDELLNRISKQKYESQIIDTLKNIQELRKGNIEALNKAGDTYLKTIEKISTVPTDVFIQSYSKYRELLEQQLSSGTAAFRDQIKIAFGDNELTQQQKVIVDNLAESYGKFFEFIKNTPGLQNFVNGLKDVNVAFDDIRENSAGVTPTLRSGFDALQFLFGDVLAIYGDYKKEVDTNGTISEVLFDPAETKRSADAFLATLKNSLLRPTQIAFDTTQRDVLKKQLALQEGFKKSAVAGSDEFNKAEIEIAKLKGQIDQLDTRLKVLNSNKPFTEFSNDVTKGVEDTVANFLKLGNGIVKVEQDIIGVNEEVKKLSTTLTGGQLGEAIGGVILQNIDIISNTIIGARTKQQKAEKEFIDKVKVDEEGLAKFRQDLAAQGIDLSNTTNDQLLQSFIAFKKKEKEVNDQAEKDKQDKYKETLAAISKGFELFSITLNQISALQRERVQTDLEGLKIAEQNALKQVVGDSEKAAAKRIEIQKEYEEQAKAVEKKGRIDSLKLSLVQTIANGAQAFVKSLAELGPILGPILAGINAALTLGQIAVINDQISNAQMMRKGGLLKAQGGMLLSGPSHENGGIPLAQMGIVAEGQETIINRQSSINFRDLLSTINQSGGGRPLVVNNFDDSRIVEAIASQKQKPLRAYVLQSEITREQAISQRLDDLSKI